MQTSKKLINDPADVVPEMIEGMVESYPNLQYLDGFPEVKVVLRADVPRGTFSKVALISGGGSGHEPAHAGFVGPGMLTAAVCGDLFASPSAHAILAAIRAVTGPPGCLLIVKNYTGDRLNFGMAAEEAKSEGFHVEMVIVGDDCALPPPRGIAGRRGLAGTLFVHKIAGAAAEAGLSLADVAAEAREVAGGVGTMGVGLTVCTPPGGVVSDRLGPTKMELGLGIHGEPGAVVTDLQPVDVVVALMLKKILDPAQAYLPLQLGTRVALMVNSLGGTSAMEVMIASGKAVAQLQLEHGLAVERVVAGALMTSADMAGISLSLLKVDDGMLSRLDAPTAAPAWPRGCSGGGWQASGGRTEISESGRALGACIEGAANAVLQVAADLNNWDREVGDGDCGTTTSGGANAILQALREQTYELSDPGAAVRGMGLTIERSMGGTSGALYAIFCRAAVVGLKPHGRNVSAKHWASALEGAVEAVTLYGGATVGDRTMLDALLPASAALTKEVAEGSSGVDALAAAAEAAARGAEGTKGMAAQAGRSSYVPRDVLRNVPDPGAMAVAAWLKGASEALRKRQPSA